MKKTLVIVSACSVLCSPVMGWADGRASKDESKKDVSVYQVPWVCPAAHQIGCGSHAKPILLELEKNPGVSEAWLNRQGTALAVVWEEDAKRKARRDVERTLKEAKASKLSGEARTKTR